MYIYLYLLKCKCKKRKKKYILKKFEAHLCNLTLDTYSSTWETPELQNEIF
jgi:hypothetical protein